MLLQPAGVMLLQGRLKRDWDGCVSSNHPSPRKGFARANPFLRMGGDGMHFNSNKFSIFDCLTCRNLIYLLYVVRHASKVL